MFEYRNSFRLKLVITYLLLVFIPLMLVGFSLVRMVENLYFASIEKMMHGYSALVKDMTVEYMVDKKPDVDLNLLAEKVKKEIHYRVTIIAPDGRVLGESDKDFRLLENHRNRPEIKKALSGEFGKSVRYSTTLGIRMFYFALPIKNNGSILGVARLAIPLAEVDHAIHRIWGIVTIVILVTLVLTIFLGTYMAKRVIDPIQQITSVAKQIARGDTDKTVPVRGEEEFSTLIKAVNVVFKGFGEAMQAFFDEKRKMHAVLSSMRDGLVAIDRERKVLFLNPAAERLFSVEERDVSGKSVFNVTRHTDLLGFIEEVLDKGNEIDEEITINHYPDNQYKVFVTPISNEKKETRGVVVALRDVTKIRHLERMRSDFVANVSHELRTPLTSIKGYLETLLDGVFEEKETALRFLNIISEETERLTRLIDDILDLSKLESRKTKLHETKISIAEVISNVVEILEPRAKKKDIDITVQAAAEFPTVEADEDMIGQVMINLLDNAIKYTPAGGKIDVSVEKANSSIKVTVRDNGVGIPVESLNRIFERFYRVDKARSRELGGTGLGLAIVKHIIESHGGEVGVKSKEGKGSEFYFSLPLADYEA